ncbi:GNAT family N-acetyltransferase [Paenibacillus melissococcoides]|uniref:GNAT family N-acetyltransferase n=1 Tax=Paenibacillus melissococcoides TaxID=2912268 RepID=A0ABM9G6F4_9BACL|nr:MULTISPECIES: GNAT family N-acetyltransferase [Paenibacillus]MEB9892098.1 GNAT family N-acetyltransferase [Bacillus cereus]CAH8247255.1 GNAT family N-acetyltransferase [Paenibacillus melissococcoides]CAH8717166.1 GNAT family N-acetyltransferase [Paenibacillus melissococcoides]CAH8718154.1 GNAT family N-acetyltransferase [Paenibacillus melissococcoides]GIO82502.1 spermidine acetyltransferase [Paenibacillus dendritiformis]
MNIHLQPITAGNWKECIALEVAPEQEGFIASNLYSIAEARFLDGFQCKGIYLDKCMIGFAMYGIDPDDGKYWIYRFMVDASYQGQGYGKRALQLLLDEIGAQPDRTEHCLLGYNPKNEAARRLYASAGFVETGIAPWGEMMAKYDFSDRPGLADGTGNI